MDWAQLITVLVQAGLGASALRLAKSIDKRQVEHEAKDDKFQDAVRAHLGMM